MSKTEYIALYNQQGYRTLEIPVNPDNPKALTRKKWDIEPTNINIGKNNLYAVVQENGKLVIDIDDIECNGVLNEYIDKTLVVKTGNDGRHYYFKDIIRLEKDRITSTKLYKDGHIIGDIKAHMSYVIGCDNSYFDKKDNKTKTYTKVSSVNTVLELDWKNFPDFAPEVGENYLIDIIIWSFVNQCKTLLKHGLYKSYVTHQENIPFLKGKLILKKQMQNIIRSRPQFACEYDELEYDNLENQIVLFCLRRSYNLTQKKDLRKDIRMLMFQLSSVISDRYITRQDFTKIHYSRQNKQYQKIHELCKIIVESSGIIDFTSDRKHIVKSFFIDMNKIFEKFVFMLFKEFFSDRYIVLEQKQKKVWNIDDERSMTIRTDILLEGKDTPEKIVIDTKYKNDISTSDLYQIGFYIHEYSQKGKELEQKRGYAILPKKRNHDELSNSEYVSIKQRITVVKSFFDIDKAVSLLYSKEPGSKNDLAQMMMGLVKIL